MLRAQYLRAILLVNNPISATVSFIVAAAGWYNNAAVWTIGGFLLASWLMNIVVLIYTKVQSMAAHKAGYFRIPSRSNGPDTMNPTRPGNGEIGRAVLLLFTLADLVFAIALIVLATLTFIMVPTAAAAAAGIGGIVAGVVHAFYVLLTFHQAALGKYRIKISIVRRDEGDRLENLGTAKESSNESSVHEAEPISPRPYRGSASTKPSKTTEAAVEGPIRLIEPTEGDSLIADHD